MLPRGPRGVVEGGLDSMIGTTCVCHLAGCGVHPWCLLPVSVFFRVLNSTKRLKHCECSPRLPALPTRQGRGGQHRGVGAVLGAVVVRSRETRDSSRRAYFLVCFFFAASENRAFRLGLKSASDRRPLNPPKGICFGL